MNYLTAIVALPLFLAITVFELWLYKNGTVAGSGAKRIVKASIVVSILQLLSCFFWFFGFVFSTTNNVLSEALEPEEEMNCIGLVGAEVILSVFQSIQSTITVYQFFLIRGVVNAIKNMKHRVTVEGHVFQIVFAAVLAIYTGLAWVTAYNRRCPQTDDVLIQFQHHFYPVYLLIDVAFAFATVVTIKKALKAHKSIAQPSQVLKGSSKSKNAKSRKNSTRHKLMAIVRFYQLQCLFTVVGGIFGVGIFILQFMANTKALSVVACVFCVLMYVMYALRRTPTLVMYLSFDWRNRKFKRVTSTSYSGSKITGAATRSNRLRSTGPTSLDPGQASMAALKAKPISAKPIQGPTKSPSPGDSRSNSQPKSQSESHSQPSHKNDQASQDNLTSDPISARKIQNDGPADADQLAIAIHV